MNYLLDAHVFAWFIVDDSLLPRHISHAIRDEDNQIYLSVASIWELALKNLKGKLPLPAEPYAYLTTARIKHRISPLPLDEDALLHLAHLPKIHADPFDRILICQAIQHSFTIITTDTLIPQYPVLVLSF